MARLIDDEKWAPVIGRFMIAFGTIEGNVNELLRQQFSDAEMKFMVALPLGKKFSLLIETVGDRKFSDAAKSMLTGNLKEALALSLSRNMIAHNPLVLSMYTDDPENGDRTYNAREVIYAEHKGKSMEFDELVTLTDRAYRAARSLTQNWIEIDMAEMQHRDPDLKRDYESSIFAKKD